MIIHKYPVIREALSSLLNKQDHFSVVGLSSTTTDAVPIVKKECADVAILDADLADAAVIGEIVRFLGVCPDTRVLVLTDVIETSVVRRAIERGVSGMFVKTQNCHALVKAIEKVAEGEMWLDRPSMAMLLSGLRRGSDHASEEAARVASLTPREREVVGLICQGLRNQEIANRLFIGEKTVRNHLASIYSKLDVGHRLELSIYAQNNGLTDSPLRSPVE